jgi:SpoVK/Ycf46/Vps4 family AAA+-type ATPase
MPAKRLSEKTRTELAADAATPATTAEVQKGVSSPDETVKPVTQHELIQLFNSRLETLGKSKSYIAQKDSIMKHKITGLYLEESTANQVIHEKYLDADFQELINRLNQLKKPGENMNADLKYFIENIIFNTKQLRDAILSTTQIPMAGGQPSGTATAAGTAKAVAQATGQFIGAAAKAGYQAVTGQGTGGGAGGKPEDKIECSEFGDFYGKGKGVKPLDTKFTDIIGLEEAKHKIQIEYVYPQKYKGLFPTGSQGILLYGPPGTGKTKLAQAAAGDLDNIIFLAPLPANLKGKYVGETEKRIQTMWDCAKAKKSELGTEGAIIFLDEFDQIGGDRGLPKNSGNLGLQSSVNTLLQLMGGFKKDENKGISIIAATNYPQEIDDAIRRRFTATIFVDLPKKEDYGELIDFNMRRYIKGDIGQTLNLYSDPEKPFFKAEEVEKYSRVKTLLKNKEMSVSRNYMYVKKDYRQEFDTITTYEVLREFLVNVFSESETARTFKANITPTSVLNDEVLKNQRGIFGYSPSDVEKIIDLIFKEASSQIVNQIISNRTLKCSQTPGGLIYVPAKSTSVKDAGLRLCTPETMKTYTLTCDHILKALDSYPSTIDNEKYVKVYKWSRGYTSED